MASSLIPRIEFTVDTPEDNTSGMVPILDFQAKLLRDTLGLDLDSDTIYQDRMKTQSYKKPTSNWLIVQEMGTLPNRAKHSTLAAEVKRPLRNTSQDTDDQVKSAILSTFSKAMQSSGYTVLASTVAI